MKPKRTRLAQKKPGLVCRPLTPARWSDLLDLFGPNGACSGCWCMYFRQTSSEYGRNHGATNRRLFHRLVALRAPTGLIAYAGRDPVGWCSVAPREDFSRIARSPTLAPADTRPAWSVVCFYVPLRHRRLGVTRTLLDAAVAHSEKNGARIVEGYPVDSKGRKIAAMAGYHGLASTFRAAGFREIERRAPTRPIMRLELGRKSRG
jgi:GNAT superfamily N-acetyltransferase